MNAITREERQALVRVRQGLVIGSAMRSSLIARGLVKTLLGGDALTPKGEQCLAARQL